MNETTQTHECTTVAIGGHADGRIGPVGPSSGSFPDHLGRYSLQKLVHNNEARCFYVSDDLLNQDWATLAIKKWELGVLEDCLRYRPTPTENIESIKSFAAELYGSHQLFHNYHDVINSGHGREFHHQGVSRLARLIEELHHKLLSLGAITITETNLLSLKEPAVFIITDKCKKDYLPYKSGTLLAKALHETLSTK